MKKILVKNQNVQPCVSNNQKILRQGQDGQSWNPPLYIKNHGYNHEWVSRSVCALS